MVAAVTTARNPKPSSLPARPPLLASDADNGGGPRRPKAREVTSRYMSSSSSSSTTSSSSSSSSSSANSFASRRSASPRVSRPGTPTAAMTPMPGASSVKRAQSVERRRPGTPFASTVDSRVGNGAQNPAASKLLVTSTRSLSVSFQGESFALQISKSKPAPSPLPNVRKGTPERRKPTPVRGGRGDGVGGADQMENSKPVDQQRWPARSRQSNIMTRSIDFTDERRRLGGSGNVSRSLQHSMMSETPRPLIAGKLESKLSNGELEKAAPAAAGSNSALVSAEYSDPIASDSDSVSSDSISGARECASVPQSRGGQRGIVVPARFWQETNNRLRRSPEPGSPQLINGGSPQLKSGGLKASVPSKLILPKKLVNDSPASSPRTTTASRGLSSPLRGSLRPASPSKLAPSSTSSPLRRAPSPSRARSSGVNSLNLSGSTAPSILNFVADVRRGKMGENRIVDAQCLRLLYNQHLQWRFVNARADATMLTQSLTTEKSLYSAWITTSKMRDSVRGKRMELQFLRQNLKLTSILKGQMLYMEQWVLLERDHSNSLLGAIKALEASTLRLPVVGGARADIQSVKDAICSAVDVMRAMASSICSLLSKVEEKVAFVTELANITKQEHILLDQCRGLLSAVASMQVKDDSLRTHILQLKGLPSSVTATM